MCKTCDKKTLIFQHWREDKVQIKSKFQEIFQGKLPEKFQENKKRVIIGGIIAAVVLFGAYAGMANSYSEKFIPGTSIDGQDISGKTVKEANEILKKKYNNKTYAVSENGKEIVKVTGQELGMKGDFATYLEGIEESQNKWSWLISDITGSQEKSSPAGIAFDEEKYKAKFGGIEFNSGERAVPEDATIELSKGKFAIKPEVYGNTLDLDKVDKKIRDEIKKGNSNIDIKDCYVQPKVKSGDSKLTSDLERMEELKEVKVTYTIAGKSVEVPKATIASWITCDAENGGVTLDSDKVKSYLVDLSAKYETFGTTRSFNSTLGGPIQVSGGTYGWTIATEGEAEALTEEFLKGKDVKRTPLINGSGYSDDGADIGKSYIEVDLSAQHMWVYENGQAVIQTPIVSGNPNNGNATPAGVFYVWSKETNKTLRGEDYATPVSFWMPIDWSGVGIHDANWQSSFGGSAYLSRGSHGCINTPYTVVSEIFNTVSVGTPVVIHY